MHAIGKVQLHGGSRDFIGRIVLCIWTFHLRGIVAGVESGADKQCLHSYCTVRTQNAVCVVVAARRVKVTVSYNYSY